MKLGLLGGMIGVALASAFAVGCSSPAPQSQGSVRAAESTDMPGCVAPDAGDGVDAGTAGDVDANDSDAGDTDAGDTDANDSDAGDTDAGDNDATANDAGDNDAADSADADDSGDTGASDNDAGNGTDASDNDAGSDAAPDAGPAKSPCADNNGGADCTPTEARFAAKSVDCYACMVNAGCLDDSLFGDTGHECGDLAGNAVSGAKAGTSKSDLCLGTIDCILDPVSLCAASDVNACYCGSLGTGNACATASTGADGACFQQEVDGLEHSASDPPSAVLPDYNDLTRGAGLANQLFVCAKSNGCDTLCAQ